jgi:hypothetical protein
MNLRPPPLCLCLSQSSLQPSIVSKERLKEAEEPAGFNLESNIKLSFWQKNIFPHHSGYNYQLSSVSSSV